MNSYQKRLQNIKYLEQCISELEEICLSLAEKVPKPMLLPLTGKGIAGDQFITPYNNGIFSYQLFQRNQ